MANRNNGIKSVKKPEFTDYTVAGGEEGWFNAAACRAEYEEERAYIRTGRSLRRMCRSTAQEPRNITTLRCGYPTKRERDEDIPSHRGVPHSNFLKRFKIVDRIAYSTAAGNLIYSAKVWVLHATRGWKVYA